MAARAGDPRGPFLESEHENTTQFFLPGVRWDPRAHVDLVFGFAALMLLSAVVCALVCFLLSGRYLFSRARCIGWSLCGLLWGPAGIPSVSPSDGER
jgi:hypothetical protein